MELEGTNRNIKLLNFLVDTENEIDIDIKGIRNIPEILNDQAKLITKESKNFKKEFTEIIDEIYSTLDMIPQNHKYDLSEFSFNLNVGVNGELSIMSLVKGNINSQSGFQIKITKKAI